MQAVSAPLAAALLSLHGRVGALVDWQVLFLFEGVPAVILGVCIWCAVLLLQCCCCCRRRQRGRVNKAQGPACHHTQPLDPSATTYSKHRHPSKQPKRTPKNQGLHPALRRDGALPDRRRKSRLARRAGGDRLGGRRRRRQRPGRLAGRESRAALQGRVLRRRVARAVRDGALRRYVLLAAGARRGVGVAWSAAGGCCS